MEATASYLKMLKLYEKIFCDSGKNSFIYLLLKFLLATYCFIMHERLFHGTEMQKSAKNVSNILYFQAKKHSANLLLHMILGDCEYENIAKE